MVMRAASVVSRGRTDEEGLSAHKRWEGREITKPVAEFGECVLQAPAMLGRRGKLDARWRDKVWLGVRVESGEILTSASERVSKARGFRKAENGGSWGAEDFDKFGGAPWKTRPGAKGMIRAEVKSSSTSRQNHTPRR